MTEGTPGTAAQVRQLFDAKAATWSEKYAAGGRLTGRLAQLVEAISQRASPGSSVLDLGCGTGDLARDMAAVGLRVTGCDISAPMLGRAAQADPSRVVTWARLHPGWQTLPFAARAFDLIVVSSVLEYVDSPADVLRECARVLRPEGTLLCTVPDLRHPVRWLEWLVAPMARPPLSRALGRRQPRLNSYLSYLRISRQRHCARWWSAQAAQAELLTIHTPPSTLMPTPLRLLDFRRPHDAGDCR